MTDLTPREMAGRLEVCQAAVWHFGFQRLAALAADDPQREQVAHRQQVEYIRLAGAWRKKLLAEATA